MKVTASGSIYRLGLVLLDRHDPTKVLARGNEWVLGPREDYERGGDVPDVVFPCGWILRDDGDTLHLYYGAGDSVVCVAEASLASLLDHLAGHPCPPGSTDLPPRRQPRRDVTSGPPARGPSALPGMRQDPDDRCMHQERDHVVSLARRCDEIIDLIDAVLPGSAVGEPAPSPAATGLSPRATPAMVVGPVR